MIQKATPQPKSDKKHQLTRSCKPDDPAQYKRFLEAAREAEADETKEGADRRSKKSRQKSNYLIPDKRHIITTHMNDFDGYADDKPNVGIASP